MSDVATVRVQTRGVLTLPKLLRHRAKIYDGTFVHVSEKDGGILITPASHLDPSVLRDVRQSLEDLKNGRVSPAFSSVEEFKLYLRNKKKRRSASK